MLRRFVTKCYRHAPVIGELLEIREELRQIKDSVHQVSSLLCAQNTATAIRLLDLELERHPRYADPGRLQRYAFQVCSQNGEDGIIHEIFRRVGTSDRIFVEVGIGDGSENNTAFLLSQGWKGFWIDSSSSFLKTIENRADLQGDCLRSLVSVVTRENIALLFAQLSVPKVSLASLF